MPRLPDASAFDRPTPRPQRNVVSDQSGQIAGQAIEQAGQSLIQIVGQREERRDRIGYANARSTLLQADIAARRELENDNDFATYETRYREKLGQARQDAAQFIRGRTDRALFEQDSAVDLERGVTEIRGQARRREVDTERASTNETLQKNHTAGLEAKDEGTRTALIQSTQEMLKGARERGYISAQEEIDLRQNWTATYAENFVSMQPVDDQLKLLAKPKGTIADYIDPYKRVVLLDRAQRQRLAEEDQAWQMSERSRRLMQEEASKDLDRRLANGQLTPAWIEQNRNRLSADDYRYGYKALDSDAVTNPDLYADLRERASLGQDVRAEARTALTGRRISRGDYDRLLSEVESERPGWYKRGSQFISTASGVSDLNPDPAGAQRKAAMLDDWAEWAQTNPKASDQDAQNAYRRIVTEYSIVNYNNMALVKRAPRFLVGDRINPNLDATEDATVKAFENGEIDEAEFHRQAQLLKEWRGAWQPTQQK